MDDPSPTWPDLFDRAEMYEISVSDITVLIADRRNDD